MVVKRNRILRVRVSEEEYTKAEREAKKSGLDISKWLRVKAGLAHESMSMKEFLAHEDKVVNRVLKKIAELMGREK